METTTLTEQAYERGLQDGKARASWVFDGNTTIETYKTFLRLYNEGDLPDDFLCPDPLSGEWADESIRDVLGDLLTDDADIDYWHGDVFEEYERGFNEAWYDTLVETAMYHTQDLDSR